MHVNVCTLLTLNQSKCFSDFNTWTWNCEHWIYNVNIHKYDMNKCIVEMNNMVVMNIIKMSDLTMRTQHYRQKIIIKSWKIFLNVLGLETVFVIKLIKDLSNFFKSSFFLATQKFQHHFPAKQPARKNIKNLTKL